jgi:hypothetical protein
LLAILVTSAARESIFATNFSFVPPNILRGGVLEKNKKNIRQYGRPTGNRDFEAMKGASDSESE